MTGVDEVGAAPADQTAGEWMPFERLSAALSEADAAQLDALRWQVITHTGRTRELVAMYAARRRVLAGEARLAARAADVEAALDAQRVRT